MRDDAQKELKAVSQRIEKAKTALDRMANFAEPKTLQMEPADLIPLGQGMKDETTPDPAQQT